MPLEIFEGSEIVGGSREWENREWFPPGPQLAICLSGGKQHLAELTDDELLQVAAAARRQTSWAQARELAAIAELTQRREQADSGGVANDEPDYRTVTARESVTEEVAAALAVTGNAAATLVHLADRLTGPLADTGAALEAGRIDLAKARVICDTTEALPAEVTQHVQAAALDKASVQTTGQLRRRIKRIVHRLAPQAAEERKREAIRQRRLELWDTASGTTDLALCDLAPHDAHGIFNKISAAAHGLKADGDPRPLHLIRADLATQLLNGAPLPDAIRALLATTDYQAADDNTVVGVPAALGAPQSVHDLAGTSAGGAASELTPVPDSGILGEPLAVRGLRLVSAGVLAAESSRAGHRASGNADDPGLSEVAVMVRRRLAHLRDRTPAADLPAAVDRVMQQITHLLGPQRDAQCQGDGERHGRPGYRPPASLRREIEARHSTCVFPTCNQSSRRCDLDHTVPWRPGITCRCNLAPLCRRHHRLKQSPGWKLHHIWPGLLVWTTPAGAWYIVRPDRQ